MIKVATFIGEHFTVAQAAKYLGYSEHTLRTYLARNQICGVKAGPVWLVPKTECDRYKREKLPRGNPSFKKIAKKKK
jgi:excisionase family DNA binding protein